MIQLTLRSLWAHKRRLVGMGTAVLLGVAFLAGTLVLADTMRAGFGGMFAEANAGTDAIVRGSEAFGTESAQQRGTVDLALVDDIRSLDGVAVVEAQVAGSGQIVGANGDPLGGDGPPTMAESWLADPEMNPYRLSEGRAPERAGEVVIDRRSAELGTLEVGDTTTLLVPERLPVEIVGIVTFGEEDSLSGMTFAGLTFTEAQQHLLGDDTHASTLVVRGDEGVSQADLAAQIAPLLPGTVEVLTGDALTAEQVDQIGADFLDFFEAFLLVFTAIALVVAMFSIYNTFSVIVAQRTRENALLRAIGASRAQVLRSTVLEATIIGVVASALGVMVGIGLATLMAGAMESMDMGSIAGDIQIDPSSLLWAGALGIAATLVAAVAPAVRSSRVPALAAMREVAVDRSGTSRARAVIGGVALVGGAALVVTAASGDAGEVILRAGLGSLVTIIGMVIAGPVVARRAAGVLGAPMAAAPGFVGELARNNAMRDPRRTAGTASALMVGVAVVVLFTVFGSSIKASIDDSIGRSFGGDLVISTGSWSGSGLDPGLVPALDALPDVDTAAAIGVGAAEIDGSGTEFVVVDPPALAAVLDLDETAGSIADLRDGSLAVAAQRAEDEGWTLGSVVPARFADGESSRLTVGAIYTHRDLLGDLILPRETWLPHTPKPYEDTILVAVAGGVALEDARASVEGVVDGFGGGDVQDRDEFVGSVAAEIDTFLAIVYALLAVSVVIALMGVANTLSLSIHERRRELGLLRAVGQTRRQLRAMVRGESVIISLFGTVGGIGLGLFLAWGLVEAMAAAEGMGSYAVSPAPLIVIVGVGIAVGAMAALRPARRAGRLDVLAAIASD